MTREKALEHKSLGNADFTKGNFKEAIVHFTNAIAEDATDHVFFSNRSACYSSTDQYEKALDDAKKCVELKPDWAKGYTRKGLAEFFLKMYDDAEKTYSVGLKLAPEDASLKEGLAKVKDAQRRASASSAFDIDPQTLQAAVKRNPKVIEYMQDPNLMQALASFMKLQNDPASRAGTGGMEMQALLQDPRLLELIMALNGVDMAEREQPFKPEPKKPKVAEPEPVDERTDEQKQADALKDEGNALYKARQFEAALEKYDKAIETVPNDVIYYNNKCAVLLEMKHFDECEKICKELLEKRYEMNSACPGGASFEKVGKIYNRLASCYQKQGRLVEAIEMVNKSLAEDNNKNTRNLLRDLQNAHNKAEKEAYYSEEKAEEHRQIGNDHFKNNSFVEAKKEYDEAIMRNPKDAKLRSNRAAALMKLMAHPDALKDLEEGIKLDPKFVKLYSRMGQCYIVMKDYNKALKAFSDGLKVDPNDEACKNGQVEIQHKMMAQGNEVDQQQVAEAMKDPEIQSILRDPQMNMILNKMQEDPKHAREAMASDPKIAKAIEKLMLAGIVRMG